MTIHPPVTAENLFNQIKNCIKDEEDGSGYLMDMMKNHINEIETIFMNAKLQEDRIRRLRHLVHAQKQYIATLEQWPDED